MRINSPIDAGDPVIKAFEERPGQALRLRLQPTIYRQPEGSKKAAYLPWPGLYWNLEFSDIEEVREFRNVLDLFFMALASGGVAEVKARLLSSG